MIGDLIILFQMMLFYVVPVLVVIFFGVSLFLFCYAKVKNKKLPDSVSVKKIKNLRVMLIVSSIMMAILVLAVAGLIALTYMVLAYM